MFVLNAVQNYGRNYWNFNFFRFADGEQPLFRAYDDVQQAFWNNFFCFGH